MATATAVKTPARKGEISSGRLLEIAANLFREHGYSSTTMRDIAEAAGMKAGSLYYHFQSKDEILDQVLERGIGEAIGGFERAQAALPAGTTFVPRLHAAVTAHLQTVYEYGTYTVASRQLLKQIPAELHDKHAAKRKHYDDLWRQLMNRGYDEGVVEVAVDVGLVRLFLLGSLNWTSEWVDPAKKSFEELGAIASGLFLHGFAHASAVKNNGTVKAARGKR